MSDVRPLGTTAPVAYAPPSSRRRSAHRPALRRGLERTQRRGSSTIDATLDLHGCTAEAARRRLQEFIGEARAGGLKRVRIVHGKGLRSGTAGPVLRAVVEHTLRSLDEIEALEPARAADGGAGAVVAVLRDAAIRRRGR